MWLQSYQLSLLLRLNRHEKPRFFPHKECLLPNKQAIGFIGAGVMGGPMILRLLGEGYEVIVHDQAATALAALDGSGAHIAESPRSVADQAPIVFTSLPHVQALKEVVLGANGLVHGQAIKVIVELSTVGAATHNEIAPILAGHAIDMVDAPVSGGAERARAGTLAIMAAGSPAALSLAHASLSSFGKVFIVGDTPGQAQLLKVLNNMLSSTAVAITSEAFVAGMRAGLAPGIMLDVFNAGTGCNTATRDKFPAHVLTGTFDYGFSLGGVCKDIDLAMASCRELGVPAQVGNAVSTLWHLAAQESGTAQDMTTLIHYIDKMHDDTINQNATSHSAPHAHTQISEK